MQFLYRHAKFVPKPDCGEIADRDKDIACCHAAMDVPLVNIIRRPRGETNEVHNFVLFPQNVFDVFYLFFELFRGVSEAASNIELHGVNHITARVTRRGGIPRGILKPNFDVMKISLIVAMGENRVIGGSGHIPWHLPADFKHFKDLTMGHPIVMGRKTFESIGKPLPGRTNIGITRDASYRHDGVVTVTSPDAALAAATAAPGGDEMFVIGGAEIYKLFLSRADRIYLTQVHGAFEGDVFFPELGPGEWQLANSEEHKKDEKNPFDFAYLVYERKSA
jgi:dihydrofolate reductase